MFTGEQTYSGVLPQPRTLESELPVVNPGEGTKRGSDDDGHHARPTTGGQHGRGDGAHRIIVRARHHADSSGDTADGQVATVGSDPDTYRKTVHPRVFVVDKNAWPLMPCHPARARQMLRSGRAQVFRLHPFTIRLTDRTVEESEVDGVQVGIDPGASHTGVAVFGFGATTGQARRGLFSVQINHRGKQISRKLRSRAALRRRRRSANLRYRKPRFANRHPQPCDSCGANAQHGKRLCRPCQKLPRSSRTRGSRPVRLAPSLQHRVDGLATWVDRLRQVAPVTGWHQELVKFDMHAMQRPGITGVEYQQGTLAGFEVREYLLAKWRHTCAYCGAKGVGPGSVPLNIDHIQPRSRGGSNRVSNLTMACVPCNQAKGNMPVEKFLAGKPAVLARILAQAKAPLSDASAVNTTRWAVWRMLADTGLPVEAGSGGRTKYNRTRSGVPKAHTLDGLCVGNVTGIASWPATLTVADSTGRGSYARTRSDKYGFPRLYCTPVKRHFGFATGDIVRAKVPSGKHQGVHIGRVAVRATGSFNIRTENQLRQGISHRFCRLISRNDGWNYTQREEEHAHEAITR